MSTIQEMGPLAFVVVEDDRQQRLREILAKIDAAIAKIDGLLEGGEGPE